MFIEYAIIAAIVPSNGMKDFRKLIRTQHLGCFCLENLHKHNIGCCSCCCDKFERKTEKRKEKPYASFARKVKLSLKSDVSNSLAVSLSISINFLTHL